MPGNKFTAEDATDIAQRIGSKPVPVEDAIARLIHDGCALNRSHAELLLTQAAGWKTIRFAGPSRFAPTGQPTPAGWQAAPPTAVVATGLEPQRPPLAAAEPTPVRSLLLRDDGTEWVVDQRDEPAAVEQLRLERAEAKRERLRRELADAGVRFER